MTCETILFNSEPVIDKQVFVEATIERAINELDTLICLANDPEAVGYLVAEKPSVGLLKTRADLLISFLLARDEPKLKLVRYNG